MTTSSLVMRFWMITDQNALSVDVEHVIDANGTKMVLVVETNLQLDLPKSIMIRRQWMHFALISTGIGRQITTSPLSGSCEDGSDQPSR